MSGTEPASQYALSGTELAYQDELSGTELAYQEHNAIGPEGFSALSLALLSRSGTTPISCYAFATRCPVLRYAMMLCVVLYFRYCVWYWHAVCCFALRCAVPS